MPSSKLLRHLTDILANIERIDRFVAGLDLQAFATNDQAIYAVLHALLIISEASRRLGSEAEKLIPGQPWPDIRSIGNVLRHEYDDVDPAVIWRIIRGGELALLRMAVEEAVARFRDRPDH